MRLAASTRLILAMFRLYADVETGFGKAVVNILKKQFPDQNVDISPATVGHKLMAIARKQLQNNDSAAMDAVQDFLTYITTGSRYETDDAGVVQRETNKDGESEPIQRKTSKPWDFAKDWDKWEDALSAMYSNLRTTAMSGSMQKMKKTKQEKTIDQAFGKRDDAGGMGEGEGRMPTPSDTELGKALDDQSAIREFYDVIDEYIPELKKSLTPEELSLFELIFDDDIGTFGSDIKENMGQASALQEKNPEMYEKNKKRWSGFVGDLRKKLLDKIWTFIENYMTPGDYGVLKETFFADVDPSAVRKKERDKLQGKEDYQRGIDERKVARYKAKQETEELGPKERDDLKRLTKKLTEQGVDVDAIKPDAGAGAGRRKKSEAPEAQTQQAFSISRAAFLVASKRYFLSA
jgi:hypothetical protein